MSKAEEPSQWSLSGLHKQYDAYIWLHTSDAAEFAALLDRSGDKFLLLPFRHVVAVQKVVRKLGQALYKKGSPYIILGCRPEIVLSRQQRITLEVAVADPKSAFDLLCTAGFRPEPMRALTVTGRRGVVCIRLLDANEFLRNRKPVL